MKSKSEKKRVDCLREVHYGIPPDTMRNDVFTVYKSSKAGQSSFRITQALLDTLLKTGTQIGKIPNLIITIGDKYRINCTITKNQ